MTPLWKSTKDVDSHRGLEKPRKTTLSFSTFPHRPGGDLTQQSTKGVGQYCSIKVGQFYIVKKSFRRSSEPYSQRGLLQKPGIRTGQFYRAHQCATRATQGRS